MIQLSQTNKKQAMNSHHYPIATNHDGHGDDAPHPPTAHHPHFSTQFINFTKIKTNHQPLLLFILRAIKEFPSLL